MVLWKSCERLRLLAHRQHHVFRMNFNMTFLISEVFLYLCVITHMWIRRMISKLNVLGWNEVLFMTCFQVTVLDVAARNISLRRFIHISNTDVLRLRKHLPVFVSSHLNRLGCKISGSNYNMAVSVFIGYNIF